jgi:hypothetical protein
MAHAHPHHHHHQPIASPIAAPKKKPGFDILKPLRQLVDSIQLKNAKTAHLLSTLIPCCCPFERDVVFFGKTLFHIPPLCKLNPLYDEFVSLRFRALSYLADECGEDITKYIC